MGIVSLLISLAIVGLVAWLLERFVPMPEAIRTIIRVVAIVIIIGILISFFTGGGLTLPRVHVN